MESLIPLFVNLFLLYLAVGLLFALVFIWKGARTVDPQADGAGRFFKVLLVPSATALWPVLLIKWLKALRRDRIA